MEASLKTKLTAAEADVLRLEREYGDTTEPDVRPLVVALVAHGFPTCASCGGHSDRLRLYPWVLFDNRTIDGNQLPDTFETPPDYDAWARATKDQMIRLDKLIRIFYKHNQEGPYGAHVAHRLHVTLGQDSAKLLDTYRLQCQGAETLRTLPAALLADKEEEILERNRQEFQAFTKFLIDLLE